MQHVLFQDLGLVDYKKCWEYQETLFNQIIQLKIANRKLSPPNQAPTLSHLLFCEHPHVYTLGKSGLEKHLLLNDQQLREHKASFYKINRGGDITYHGPGQLVGYPILDLDNFFTDIHKYLRFLEEAVIRTLEHYQVYAGRIPGVTGVWIDPEDKIKTRKICAMGVRCSRWVTMHGFAFNINTDLDYFGRIIPCGIADKAVTSLHKELGREVDMSEVKELLKEQLSRLFEMELLENISKHP